MNTKRKDLITHSIYSNILKEERSFLVNLPKNHDEENIEYPVLYHLDGGSLHIEDILGFPGNKNSEDSITDMIYVSVVNTDRVRDMSPVKTSFCEKPGAKQFLKFFESELIPYINKNYQTSKFNVLCGQSFSSIFTLYAMLEKPSLFNGYITTSLYFPQCKEYFMDRARKTLATKKLNDRYLFMTLGRLDYDYNKDKITEHAIEDLIQIIKEQSQTELNWEYRVYEEHGHCPEPSYSDGLKWIFDTRINKKK